MRDVILIRYGEIALKGKNRNEFEKRLVRNIKDCFNKNKIEVSNIFRIQGRILVYTSENCKVLSKVAGIVSYSYAKEVGLDLEEVKSVAAQFYEKGKTFKIETKRLQKKLKLSPEISREVGVYVCENCDAEFAMTNPEQVIGVEVMQNNVSVFSDKEKGMGGLPAGIEGQVCLILEDERSVEAGILMIKRGCSLCVLKEKDIDYSKLKEYAYGFKLKEVDDVPDNILAVIVNDTLDNLKERKYDKLVLRPLAK
ncbi:MAG: THUMP domain-containing protein [archaeon]